MNHDDHLILCGLDALEAQIEDELRALDERDRLDDYVPASVLPPVVTARSDRARVTPVHGRRQPEDPEHRRVRDELYGRRSGTVENVISLRLRHSFRPLNIDAAPGPDRPDAA